MSAAHRSNHRARRALPALTVASSAVVNPFGAQAIQANESKPAVPTHDPGTYVTYTWPSTLKLYYQPNVTSAMRSMMPTARDYWPYNGGDGRAAVNFYSTSDYTFTYSCANYSSDLPNRVALRYDDGPGGTYAVTCTTWVGSDLKRAQITFDSGETWNATDNNPTPSQLDFKSVAVHELGHALGFDTHFSFNGVECTPTNPNDRHTMCPFWAYGLSGWRTPAAHDLHTMFAAYP
jgi:hypothetical protein